MSEEQLRTFSRADSRFTWGKWIMIVLTLLALGLVTQKDNGGLYLIPFIFIFFAILFDKKRNDLRRYVHENNP